MSENGVLGFSMGSHRLNTMIEKFDLMVFQSRNGEGMEEQGIDAEANGTGKTVVSILDIVNDSHSVNTIYIRQLSFT